MRKKRFFAGLLIIILALGVCAATGIAHKPKASYSDWLRGMGALALVFPVLAIVIIVGLVLSLGELARSVIGRLKVARERNKAIRDRQRQARQNKPGSASQ